MSLNAVLVCVSIALIIGAIVVVAFGRGAASGDPEMLKVQEENDPYSTWNRAKPSEPVFVIAAHDPLAIEIIEEWATRAGRSGVDPNKVAAALDVANEMRYWRARNRAPR